MSDAGGIPIVIRRLLATTDPIDVEFHVITVRPDFPEDRLADVGWDIHPLGLTGPPNASLWALGALRAARAMRGLRPDVIHAHSGTAMLSVLAATVTRPRLRLLDVHDAPGNGRHGRMTERLEGVLGRHLGYRVIVHSSSVADECRTQWRLRREPVLIPLGIPTLEFDVGPRRITDRDAAKTVLYVARLVPSKDVDLLLRVAELVTARAGLERTRFVVVADGPERPRLEAEITARGLTGVVVLERARTGPALVAAYRDADLFLSTSAYEGFGLAVVEAMAAGLPVVATAVGGVTDLVVERETGLLAPAGDADALATGVATLLEDAGRAHRIGVAGRTRARECFDVVRMAAEYRALYEAATPRSPRVAVLKSPAFGRPEAGAELPYRIDHLAALGLELRWTDRHLEAPFATGVVARAVRFTEGHAVPWLQTALLLPSILRADATVGFFESEANALATLRRFVPGLRHRPLVVLTCWLADLLEREPGRARRYRRAYRLVDRLGFFSSNQAEILMSHLDLDRARLRFVPFGVDDERFRPLSGPDGGYVACVGRDKGRDWPTFMRAAERAGLPVKVACRPRDLLDVRVPDNVEVLGQVDPERYRSLIGRARVSVVPTVERAYPTGQSVALESMAMRRATVITATPAMADYLSPGVNGLGVPVGDPAALADAMELAYADEEIRQRLGENGRAAVENRFNARAMWSAIAALVDEALDENPRRRRQLRRGLA